MKTILVVGGAGFLGSHLCDLLLKMDYNVVCVDNLITGSEENISHLKDNNSFTFINHNVIEPLSFSGEVDAIFHLASPASPNHHSHLSYHALPMETMLVNTQGTRYLLELAKEKNAKFLYASTSEAYGDPLVHPQTEEYRGNVSTTGPRSVYDEAKRFGETITAHYERSEGVDARIVRIFNTYGPRMAKDDGRMVVVFVKQALAQEDISLFGDGLQTRSLCFVSDLVEGLQRLMFMPGTRGEVVNLGSDSEHTILEYATLIKRLVGSSSKIVVAEQLPEDDPLRRRPDISKAKRLLDWKPVVGLEDGLSELIEYCKKL